VWAENKCEKATCKYVCACIVYLVPPYVAFTTCRPARTSPVRWGYLRSRHTLSPSSPCRCLIPVIHTRQRTTRITVSTTRWVQMQPHRLLDCGESAGFGSTFSGWMDVYLVAGPASCLNSGGAKIFLSHPIDMQHLDFGSAKFKRIRKAGQIQHIDRKAVDVVVGEMLVLLPQNSMVDASPLKKMVKSTHTTPPATSTLVKAVPAFSFW
jgi:hypothetical protein